MMSPVFAGAAETAVSDRTRQRQNANAARAARSLIEFLPRSSRIQISSDVLPENDELNQHFWVISVHAPPQRTLPQRPLRGPQNLGKCSRKRSTELLDTCQLGAAGASHGAPASRLDPRNPRHRRRPGPLPQRSQPRAADPPQQHQLPRHRAGEIRPDRTGAGAAGAWRDRALLPPPRRRWGGGWGGPGLGGGRDRG